MLSDSDLVFGKTLETRKREEMKGTGSSWCCLIRIWFLEKLWRLEGEKKEAENEKQLVLSDSDLVFGKTVATRKTEEVEKVWNGEAAGAVLSEALIIEVSK